MPTIIMNANKMMNKAFSLSITIINKAFCPHGNHQLSTVGTWENDGEYIVV